MKFNVLVYETPESFSARATTGVLGKLCRLLSGAGAGGGRGPSTSADEQRMTDTGRVVERVVRESYGRLVAYLGARWRDLAAVEDTLGDALAAALTIWPRDGIPIGRKPGSPPRRSTLTRGLSASATMPRRESSSKRAWRRGRESVNSNTRVGERANGRVLTRALHPGATGALVYAGGREGTVPGG